LTSLFFFVVFSLKASSEMQMIEVPASSSFSFSFFFGHLQRTTSQNSQGEGFRDRTTTLTD
jgi:hypothetical protein